MRAAPDERSSELGLEVFDPAPVGVAVTRERDRRLVYANAVYRAIFGDRTLKALAQEAFSGHPDRDYYYGLADQVLASGQPVTVTAAPVKLAYADAGPQERFFTFSLSEIALGDGERGVLLVSAEVTEQVTAARQIQSLAENQRRLLQRYQKLGSVGVQMFWVADAEGGFIEPSPSWERMTGQSWEEFRGDGWLNALHHCDREPTARAWKEALEQVVPLWEHAYRLRLADGSYRHFGIRAVPVLEGESVVEWVGTCTDIEQEWQESRRRELLDRAAAATADITRLEEMLTALTHVIVPDLADGCIIYLLPQTPDRPEASPISAHHAVSAVRPGLPELPERGEETFDTENIFTYTVRRRRPVHRTFPPGKPAPGAAPAAAEAWLVSARANSVVLVPVIVDGTVAAVVSASACGERTPISMADVALISQMFDHAHDPLSNAIEYRRTQRVALALQHSLLPEPPAVPGLQIASRYRPSPAAAEVGGDWYDCFRLRDGATMLTIGDVAGHDLPAAVTMSQIRNMLRGLAVDREEPVGDILRRLDIAMETLYGEETVTCVLARVERPEDGPWRLSYSVAGHPPPLMVTDDGGSRFLEGARAPILGVLRDGPRASAVEPLPPGGTLLLYTDGLVERPGEDIGEGLDRLRHHAARLARRPLEAFCDELLATLADGGDDDIAMIAVRLPSDLLDERVSPSRAGAGPITWR
ncbi:PAS domain S-box-containing protein [Streptosporangium album]|uniref:protein-serine/threonine phosphatase n=1 Tax=Streptosporangium album TaxID=47479 RepID=A0A7W7WEV9_9ACTN|nr:SpoIIE family protein phosphatase [Streptosporangium album]MBB4943784.1 PAS domain S-box-containing protein [Streptosporangium album]